MAGCDKPEDDQRRADGPKTAFDPAQIDLPIGPPPQRQSDYYNLQQNTADGQSKGSIGTSLDFFGPRIILMRRHTLQPGLLNHPDYFVAAKPRIPAFMPLLSSYFNRLLVFSIQRLG